MPDTAVGYSETMCFLPTLRPLKVCKIDWTSEFHVKWGRDLGS